MEQDRCLFLLIFSFVLAASLDVQRQTIEIPAPSQFLWRGPGCVSQNLTILGSTVSTTTIKIFSPSNNWKQNSIGFPVVSVTVMGKYILYSSGSTIIVTDSTEANSTSHVFSGFQIMQGGSTKNFTVFYGINTSGTKAAFLSTLSALLPTQTIFANARNESAVTSIGNFIVFAGGKNLTSFSDLVDIWDSSTLTVRTTLRLQDKRTQITAVSNSKYAIFAGGITQPNQLYNKFEVFDSSTINWIQPSTNSYPFNFPVTLGSIAACSLSNSFLFTGTTNGQISATIYTLTLSSETLLPNWTNDTSLAFPKQFVAGITTLNACFFVGGKDSENTIITNMEVFSVSDSGTTSTGNQGQPAEIVSPITWLIIVGIVAGFLFVILVIIVIIVFYLFTKQSTKDETPLSTEGKSQRNSTEMQKPKKSSDYVITRPKYVNFRQMNMVQNTPLSFYTGPQLTGVELLKQIGEGNFSVAYAGDYKQQLVCVKKLKYDEQNLIDSMKEAELLWQLRHPHIVRLLGVYVDPLGAFCIVNEMMKGDLRTYLTEFPDTPYHVRVNMAIQAVSAMMFLEKNKIVHKDLALRNLLISVDEHSFYVKLSDFGLARRTIGGSYISLKSEITVAVKWAAPEVLASLIFTTKSDVYSFGVMLWELFTLDLPYAEYSNEEAVDAIRTKSLLPFSSQMPPDLRYVINSCWAHVSVSRPSFAQLNSYLSSLEC